MRFRVIVLPSAESEIAYAADWIAEYSLPSPRQDGLRESRAAISTLSEMPLRCPVAADDFGRGLIVRQLFYGRRRNRYPVHG
jgi:plasmid stabilization system protein ParE